MLTTPRNTDSETGSAMIAALALLVLAAFVAIAIVISAMSSSDTTRRQLDSSTTEMLARDAGTALGAIYSAVESGEQDGFVPNAAIVRKHMIAMSSAAQVVANDATHNDVSPSIPNDANHRFTVRIPLEDGRLGYWQPYAAIQPTWGTTKAGLVEFYVRAWTSAANGSAPTRAQIYRIVMRPTWFADYQVIADGKFLFSNGANITGRVHSNGALSSYGGQFDGESWSIEVSGTASCSSTARISTTSGSIRNTAGGCPYSSRPHMQANVDQHINILRARDAVESVRKLCGLNAGIAVICSSTTNDITVTIGGGNNVSVSGAGSANATVTSNATGARQGVVVVARGHVHVRGRLSSRGRLTIMTAARAGQTFYGSGGSAPSIFFDGGSGNYGAAAGDPSSSFGAVAEGDIVVDETRNCGGSTTLRGAFIAVSGLLSANPRWRGPLYVAGGTVCNARLTVEGSIVGHYGPIMYVDGMGGFRNRTYRMLPALYDNPPPMYPTISDWQTIRFAPADANCFSATRMPKPQCA